MKSNDISRRWKGNVETPLKGMSIYSYGIFCYDIPFNLPSNIL